MNKGADMAVSTPFKDYTNLKAALGYARQLGWSVFPVHSIINNKCSCNNLRCESKGKHPATRNGLKDATTNEKQIIKYWTEKPYLNIGVATGKVSGFFVVDIDNKIHRQSGKNGFETLEELEQDNGKLPDTVEQKTGSGGSHLLFKYQEGIKNKVNLFPSIDIRGDGGYIVVSPSIHNSGYRYYWELSSHPLKVQIAQAPKWLLNAINPHFKNQAKSKYKARPVSEYLRILQGICEGERNNSLVTLIGHLLARDIDYREAFEIVEMWNECRVDPPLSKKTVKDTFNNILRLESEKR